MSNNLSPQQFGFLPRPEEEWYDARVQDYAGVREIPVDHPLHTGQRTLYADRVQHYVEHPESEHLGRDRIDKDYPHALPEVYRTTADDGVTRDYMGEGHHRVAAARVRGDKTIKVAWHEWQGR